MAECGFDKLCHTVFVARDNGVDFLSRATGVSCGRCGNELVAYYCESRLYMVQCRHCAIKSLVMAKDRKEAAEKICGRAADVVEVRRGRWEKAGTGITERIVCSACGSSKGAHLKPPFCNQCGADMRERSGQG